MRRGQLRSRGPAVPPGYGFGRVRSIHDGSGVRTLQEFGPRKSSLTTIKYTSFE